MRGRLPGRILFVVLAVGSFLLDRLTKVLVIDSIAVGERRQVVEGVLELRHIHNRGIAFGLFSGAGSLVVLGTLLVGVLLFVFMLRVEPTDLVTIAGGGLITGGAIGNLTDRIVQGYVTDFLHLPRWPTFNVADIAICAGVALVIIMQLVEASRERAEHRTASSSGSGGTIDGDGTGP